MKIKITEPKTTGMEVEEEFEVYQGEREKYIFNKYGIPEKLRMLDLAGVKYEVIS